MKAVESRGPVSEEQVSGVESELGLRLPDPYRSWMKETNGGDLPADTPVPGSRGPGLITYIDAIDRLPIIGRLASTEIVPPGYLVISQGAGGCLTIRMAQDDYGSVWWADFDLAEEVGIWEEPSEKIMIRLADDWDAFLALEVEE